MIIYIIIVCIEIDMYICFLFRSVMIGTCSCPSLCVLIEAEFYAP